MIRRLCARRVRAGRAGVAIAGRMRVGSRARVGSGQRGGQMGKDDEAIGKRATGVDMETEPQALLGNQVRELLGVERAIEQSLGRQSDVTLALPELHAALAVIQARCSSQSGNLEHYLRANDLDPTAPPSPVAQLLEVGPSSGILARALCANSAALGFAASGYAVLTELALRLYDPDLRELAPRHLASHARGARLLNHLLPSVIVQELDRLELHCRCICPMCSLGACGCTEAGRGMISEAWREARPDVDERPGLTITPPRQGSQLADHRVRGGERLVAIDGEPLTASGMGAVIAIQAAIRKHGIGDELLLAIAHDAGQDHELRVRHVSDFPSG